MSLISVYQRCLANYQSRQWDMGAHVMFNTSLHKHIQAELPHMAAEKDDTDKVKKSAGKSKKPKAEEEAKKPKAEDDGIAAALLAAKSKMLNINSFWSGFEVFAADKHMPSDELLANVAELIQDGALQVVVDSVHELRDLDKAHQVVESFHAAGKV